MNLISTWEKMNLDLTSHLHKNQCPHQGLNMKGKVMQLLEENIGICPYVLGVEANV